MTLNPVPVPTAPLYRLPGRKKKEEGNGEGGGCGRVLGDGRGTRESLQATEAIWNATVLLAALEPDAGAEFLAAAGPHRRDDVRTHTHTHRPLVPLFHLRLPPFLLLIRVQASAAVP